MQLVSLFSHSRQGIPIPSYFWIYSRSRSNMNTGHHAFGLIRIYRTDDEVVTFLISTVSFT